MTSSQSDLPPEIANDHSYQDFTKNRYPTWKLIWESIYLGFSIILWIFLVRETVSKHSSPLTTLIGFVVSQLLVDYVSGFVHWAGDTWGTLRTPVLGTALIGPFRMHHVDPQDICIHQFMETNAASSYPMPFFLIFCLTFSSGSFLFQTFNWMVVFGVPLGIMTNECHKWAHMVHSKPSKAVRFLQQAGLVISPEKHLVHHQGDFDKAYCIVNGWMNPILDACGHWKFMENLFRTITGAIPREDDGFWREVNDRYKEAQKGKAQAK